MRRAVFHPLAQLEVVDEVIPVEARGVRKSFGHTVALDGIDLTIGEGRILGLVGPNGAGKTTFLHAMLGLTPYEGTLRVLGHDPRTERHRLMRDATFIADVSILPRWMRVSQALDYMEGGRIPGAKGRPPREHDSRIVEGSSDAAPPIAHHGHRCAVARAGRADARPRSPPAEAVLRDIADGLLR